MRSGITLEFDERGRHVHTFRQSWLNTADNCLERGRAELAGLMPEEESDAAAIGTSVHFGIEAGEHGLMNADPWSPDDLVKVGLAKLDRLVALPEFRWVKYTPEKARWLVTACLELFWEAIYHTLDPILIEENFGPITIYEDDERVIRITGTIDLLDGLRGPIDWKTTGQGRKYRGGFGGEGWQLDRWGAQPPTYNLALHELAYLDGSGPWPFTFAAFDISSNDVSLDTYTVLRGAEDFDWLRDKCFSYAMQIEADFSPWPRQDDHALCSPKWCGHWPACKGLHYADVEWPVKAR